MNYSKELKTFLSKAAKTEKLRIPKYVHFYDDNKVEIITTREEVRFTLPENHELNGMNITLDSLLNVNKVWKTFAVVNNGNEVFATNGKGKRTLTTNNDKIVPRQEFIYYKELPIQVYEEFMLASNFISSDETRYFMNGVLIDGDLTVVATDGRRLYRAEVDGEPTDIPTIIAASKVLEKIDPVHLYLTKDGLFIDCITEEYFLCKINGQFPNYKRVIPDSKEYVPITLPKDLSITEIKKFMKVDKINRMRVDNTKIGYTENSSDILVYEEPYNFECDVPFNIAIDVNYFENFLTYLDSNKLMYTAPNKAIYMIDKHRMIIVMPMQQD